jgi:hypothetical protein
LSLKVMVRSAAGPVAGPPAAGLAWWVRADLGVYQDLPGTLPATVDGQPVAFWEDQAPLGREAVQATALDRPVWKPGAIAGKPSLLSDAGAAPAALPHLASAPLAHGIGAGAFSIYAVARVASLVPPSFYHALWQNGVYAPGLFLVGQGVGTTVQPVLINGASESPFAAVLSTGSWNTLLVTRRASDNLVRCWVNGALDPTSYTLAFTAAGSAQTVLAKNDSGNAVVEVAEVGLYSACVETTGQKSELDAYLLARYGLPAAPAQTLPSGVAGLTGWWRSDGPLWKQPDRTQPAVAPDDLVAVWDNLAAGAPASTHAAQATGSMRPILKPGLANGLPALRFDGSDDLLITTANLAAFFSASTYCIYAVWRVTTAPASDSGSIYTNKALYGSGAGWMGQYARASGAPGPTIIAQNYTAATEQSAGVSFSVNTWYGTRQRHAGGQLTLKRTGAAEVSVPSGDTGAAAVPFLIGANYAANGLAVEIAELFIYNVDPPAGDRTALENYLAARYLLTW